MPTPAARVAGSRPRSRRPTRRSTTPAGHTRSRPGSGGVFCAESKFHTVRDASKVALVALRDLLAADADPRRLIDVQWQTDHLATLGVSEMSREDYLSVLPEVLSAPLPAPWA